MTVLFTQRMNVSTTASTVNTTFSSTSFPTPFDLTSSFLPTKDHWFVLRRFDGHRMTLQRSKLSLLNITCPVEISLPTVSLLLPLTLSSNVVLPHLPMTPCSRTTQRASVLRGILRTLSLLTLLAMVPLRLLRLLRLLLPLRLPRLSVMLPLSVIPRFQNRLLTLRILTRHRPTPLPTILILRRTFPHL